MTIHHCPKCELRFERKTELDDHCWHDHPEFRHEYPAQAAAPPVAEPAPPVRPAEPASSAHRKKGVADGILGWMVPRHPAEVPRAHHPREEEHDG